jgi:hypothetical protein
VLEGVRKKDIIFFTFILGCITWSLWPIRNDFGFNNIVVASADVVLYGVIFESAFGPLSGFWC